MRRGHSGGFTIVELLIVIVVIAILAAISIVVYSGLTSRSYTARAHTELASIARAINMYHAVHDEYPDDVERNIPVGIFDYIDHSAEQWPIAPWPGSVYDYDHFDGSDGNPVVQISIRFCPIGGPISACNFPNEPWAEDFGVNSSAYWCMAGQCRAHRVEPDNYPGYCLNCSP